MTLQGSSCCCPDPMTREDRWMTRRRGRNSWDSARAGPAADWARASAGGSGRQKRHLSGMPRELSWICSIWRIAKRRRASSSSCEKTTFPPRGNAADVSSWCNGPAPCRQIYNRASSVRPGGERRWYEWRIEARCSARRIEPSSVREARRKPWCVRWEERKWDREMSGGLCLSSQGRGSDAYRNARRATMAKLR